MKDLRRYNYNVSHARLIFVYRKTRFRSLRTKVETGERLGDKRKSDKDFCLKGKSHVILYLARHLAPRIKKLARKIEGDKGLWKRAKDKEGEHDEIDKKSWNVSAFFVQFSEAVSSEWETIQLNTMIFLEMFRNITIWRSCQQ